MTPDEEQINYLQTKFLIMATIISMTIIMYCLITNQVAWQPFALMVFGLTLAAALNWNELKELCYLTKLKAK